MYKKRRYGARYQLPSIRHRSSASVHSVREKFFGASLLGTLDATQVAGQAELYVTTLAGSIVTANNAAAVTA